LKQLTCCYTRQNDRILRFFVFTQSKPYSPSQTWPARHSQAVMSAVKIYKEQRTHYAVTHFQTFLLSYYHANGKAPASPFYGLPQSEREANGIAEQKPRVRSGLRV